MSARLSFHRHLPKMAGPFPDSSNATLPKGGSWSAPAHAGSGCHSDSVLQYCMFEIAFGEPGSRDTGPMDTCNELTLATCMPGPLKPWQKGRYAGYAVRCRFLPLVSTWHPQSQPTSAPTNRGTTLVCKANLHQAPAPRFLVCGAANLS